MHVREWRTNAECDFVDASHTGYACMTHRRRVLFVKPDYLGRRRRCDGDNGGRVGKFRRNRTEIVPTPFPCISRSRVSVCADGGVAGARSMGARADAGRQYAVDRIVHAGVGETSTEEWRAGADSWLGCRAIRPAHAGAAARVLRQDVAAVAQRDVLMPQPGSVIRAAVSALFDDHNLPIASRSKMPRVYFVDETDIFRSRDL